MEKFRYERMKSYAVSHNLQIVKIGRCVIDGQDVDFALVGFGTFSELKKACEALDLAPMEIRINDDSELHNSVKSLEPEELLYEINNRAKRWNLNSSYGSFYAYNESHERRFPFILNQVKGLFYVKETTDRTMFISLESWLSNFWETLFPLMTNDNMNIDEKRVKIQALSKTLELYNLECVPSDDGATANMNSFLKRVIYGLQLALEKDDEKFVKYIDSLTKIVTGYINMSSDSMLVIHDGWLSKCNYEIVPIKYSMVDKVSENRIIILGAVAYGESVNVK